MPTQITAIAFLYGGPYRVNDGTGVLSIIQLDEGHDRPVWSPVITVNDADVKPVVPETIDDLITTAFQMLLSQLAKSSVRTVSELNSALADYRIEFFWFTNLNYSQQFDKLASEGLQNFGTYQIWDKRN